MSDDVIDPIKAKSTSEMRVRFCETDLMGIVHHSNYLLYFEAGRVEWLRRRGVAYSSWAQSGIHLPVVEVNLKYFSPARFDDVLTIDTTLVELRAVSLRFGYEIRCGETKICAGVTRLGCIDSSHKLYRIPDDMRAILFNGELTDSKPS